MKLVRVLVAALVSATLSSPVLAGPNAGGVLIVHASPEIVYTAEDVPYTNQSDLADCNLADTNLSSGTTWVWWVSAAFPPGSAPRLAGVTFGIDYIDSAIVLVDFGPNSDFQLTTTDWPSPGEGTALTWTVAQQTELREVYWFAGFAYYGLDVSFDLIAHPTGGSVFADDTIPAILDAVADFGRLGFNGNPGYLACPDPLEPLGACCLDCCVCMVVTELECNEIGGNYGGDDFGCDPNPCACNTGACCLPDETCELRCEHQCAGDFLGYDVPCDPNPCEVTPTIESSWGRVKTVYR